MTAPPGPIRSTSSDEMLGRWEASFAEQVQRHAYNTAPVEALVRTVAYYLRHRAGDRNPAELRFLELGCGAGPNLVWLAERGITVSGVDIAPTAIGLARRTLGSAGHADRIGDLIQASVSEVPFPDATFDGILEACVFQHLPRPEREAAFREVGRLLKPGGVFVGYMLDQGHTVFGHHRDEQVAGDPGTLVLKEGRSRVYLTNIGSSHFFSRDEFRALLPGFSVVDPCLTTYFLPAEEARHRGYDEYLQSMWTVYAVK